MCGTASSRVSSRRRKASSPPPPTSNAFYSRCLLVEDNLFIAIDAEDLLRSLGAESVVVANSVADALAVLATQSFSFALLDVSLGPENSLPVARYAKAHSVPFAFGTGYGEDLTMGEALVDVPIITKPYHRVSMLKALDRLIVPKAPAPQNVWRSA